ncbi:hypothetical protein QTP70_006453 [Hemibagrus guttatus]|uniref:Hexosyltransferase n=1 Tax=Hemibagrus guttatus TaxID=175788 RepID=A0AAE0UL98_9TELE|nr:hypothetical protein QTP70_006453 [Hemibagrus guttatus]
MMMACIKIRFKICFIFLLLVVFIGLLSINMTKVSNKPPKDWLNNIARHVQSFYLPKQIQSNGNQTPSETSRLNTSQDTTTQTYHEAYPRNYRFIIDEPEICKQQKPFLVLMVPVAPQQLEARNAIRRTWGNESVVQGKNITVLFVLGLRGDTQEANQQEQLSLEGQKYHDLIQSDFVDTYKNLTTKTMVLLHWLATRCPQASYAMKIDSDMFLNLENLMSLLLAPDTPKENYITGMVMWNRPVVRDPSSKWYVPKDVYPEDAYPTYLLGMGYVFSNDLPEKLVRISKDIQPFSIEDAYVGACLKKLGVPPSNPPDPSRFKAYHSGDFIHSEFSRVITTILSSPQQLCGKAERDPETCLDQKTVSYLDLESFYVSYPNKYRFILDQPHVCKRHNPYIVIIVPVAPRDVQARNAIRSTWGNGSLVKDGDVLVLFLLGLPSGNDFITQQLHIHQENERHQDLLQSNFIDSYRNLTIKTMVMLEWLRDRCPQAYYAAKVDADMLLNVVALMQMLLSPSGYHSNYITGLVWYENIVIRDPYHKFYIPYEVYPKPVYPPYPLGMCYIISMDLPEKILDVSKKIKPIFIEDAYIGLCLEQLHITPTNPPNIEQFVVKPPLEYDRCYYSDLIAVITNSPAQLVSYWTDLQKPGPACNEGTLI